MDSKMVGMLLHYAIFMTLKSVFLSQCGAYNDYDTHCHPIHLYGYTCPKITDVVQVPVAKIIIVEARKMTEKCWLIISGKIAITNLKLEYKIFQYVIFMIINIPNLTLNLNSCLNRSSQPPIKFYWLKHGSFGIG